MKKGNYFLVSCHREENVDSESQFKELATSINTIAKTYNLPVLVSTHPRTKKRIEQFGITFDKNVNLLKPFGFLDYNALQMNARAVLSDSGTISEESSILNFPAINIREAHERPEAMEEASVIMAGLKEERILRALTMLENQNQRGKRSFNLVEDYASPNVSEKVARIILSYTDYVNRVVWKQY
jgi:UDP-N-acetylglucosamine 2-epimerase (non-hydrolysing)